MKEWWANLLSFLSDSLSDVRYACRTLMNSPGFACVAVLSLALGIGASTTVFSVLNSVVLNRFPYQNQERLVVIENTDATGRTRGVAPANFLDWQRQAQSFAYLAAKLDWTAYDLTGSEGSEQIIGAPVSAGMFEALGLTSALGRTFSVEDDRPHAEPTVIIGDRLWERRYSRNPAILGRRVSVSGVLRTVIGVMPRGVYLNRDDFGANGHVDELWIPLRSQLSAEVMNRRDASNLRVFARLKPGVSPGQAMAEMQLVNAALKKLYPKENGARGVVVKPLAEFRAERIRTPREVTFILFGAVSLVLLVACANVAGLQLARAVSRQREIAIRVSLGAGPFRILRQLVTESLLLGFLGGALGLALAVYATRVIKGFLPNDIPLPRLDELAVDHRVLGYSLVISLLAGLVTGISPIRHRSFWVASSGLGQALRSSSRNVAGERGISRFRRYLMSAQVALALILLFGSGLLIRSFVSLRGVSPGFARDHLLTVRMPAPDVSSAVLESKEYQMRRSRFVASVLEQIGQLSGVSSVAAANGRPGSGELIEGTFLIDGFSGRGTAINRIVTPDYFRALGLPILAGRSFQSSDTQTAPLVAVIDASLAERYFSNDNPLGKRIQWRGATNWATVVGVVGKIRDNDLRVSPQPEIYSSWFQVNSSSLRTTLLIRPSSEPLALVPRVRQAIHDLNPDQPIGEVATIENTLERATAAERFNATLLTIFAATALFLAVIGIYGVVSYCVAGRTNEIGIRLALGAGPRSVLQTILRREIAAVLIGLFGGGLIALLGGRVLRSMLHDVSSMDPLTFVGVALILLVSAMLASSIPVRRAIRIDPMAALRHE